MAVPEVATDVLAREKMSKEQKANDKKLVATAQDIKYARYLSDNNAKTRQRALKSLRRWVQHRCQSIKFTELDLMLIWKGLFYSMWMSDKLLVQEECAENISHLIHSLTPDQALLYFKCGLRLLGNEWFGIDQHRLDKFMMLVRRLLRQALEVVKKQNFNAQFVKRFASIMEETIMSTSNRQPMGLCLHFTEIYLEELSKISEGKISESTITQFVTPFIKQLAFSDEKRLLGSIQKHIFTHLMNQSDIGIEHADKFNVWRQMKFAGGNIDKMQKVGVPDESDDDSEGEDVPKESGVLDPRAGKVDIVLPQLRFSAKQIINIAQKYRYHPESTNHSRKVITKLIEDFTEMSRGKYPLGLKKIDLPVKDKQTKVSQSAKRLLNYNKKITSDNRRNVYENEGEGEEVERPKKGKKRQLDDDLNEQIDGILGKNRKKKKKRIEDWNVETTNGQKTLKSKKSMREVAEVPMKKSKATDDDDATLKKKNINYTNKNKYKMNDSAFEVCLNNFETAFVRNSGLWNVFNKGDETTSESSNESEDLKTESPRENGTANGETFRPDEMSTPKKSVFPQSEWDAPLQEGETEIFIPYKKRLPPTSLQSHAIRKIKGKNHRFSLDPDVVRNPLLSSSKKVKINLRLNKSQEVHEHVAQIKSSPAIPFDANRKPEKPLLKANAVASPVNPFYKNRINI